MPNLVAELSQLNVEPLEVVTDTRLSAPKVDLETVASGDPIAYFETQQENEYCCVGGSTCLTGTCSCGCTTSVYRW